MNPLNNQAGKRLFPEGAAGIPLFAFVSLEHPEHRTEGVFKKTRLEGSKLEKKDLTQRKITGLPPSPLPISSPVPQASERRQGVLSIKENIKLGQELLSQGKFQEAEAPFKTALAIQARCKAALVGLGDSSRLQKKIEEAEDYYKRALTIDLAISQAHVGLGKCSLSKEDIRGARAHFCRALDYEPGNSHALVGVGECDKLLNNFVLAVHFFTLALKSDPTCSSAFSGLGDCAVQKNNLNEADVYYQQALRCNPLSTHAKRALSELRKSNQTHFLTPRGNLPKEASSGATLLREESTLDERVVQQAKGLSRTKGTLPIPASLSQ